MVHGRCVRIAHEPLPWFLIGSQSQGCPSNEAQTGTPALSVNSRVADGKADTLIAGREDGHTPELG